MNLFKRLKVLWELSDAKINVIDHKTGESVYTGPISEYKESKPATFIPYTKIDPIKKITEENA